ncbi:enterochelin esterase family protein [Hamadaea flava]|uniref:Enterochelin esterase n=1 Tax=Hamadaea flava TaxID=1742688 RepID=A0ABV8LKW8_9ACTN|nr:enterochelin esterase [Hamadaea flava]MCP2323588.1 enterochelin esterase family protein [Hamadaea flava]
MRATGRVCSAEPLCGAETPSENRHNPGRRGTSAAPALYTLHGWFMEGTMVLQIDSADDPHYRIVTITYQQPAGEPDPHDVFLRFVTLDENARRARDLTPYLMSPEPGGLWRWTARLRADFRASYQICPSPTPLPTGTLDDQAWTELLATGVADASNPATFPTISGNPGPASIVELPQASAQPWRQPRPGTAAGALVSGDIDSDVLANTRRVWTYLPPGGVHADSPADVVVLLDGGDWMRIDVTTTLDNLIADQAIGPTVVVMVDTEHTRWQELPDHPRFLRFLVEELMPWITSQWPVTADPTRTVIAGQSLGGLMPAYTGLHASHRFGLVLTQSGSFQWPKGSEFDTAAGAVIRQYAAAPRVPIRIFQEAGLVEVLLLDKNRHMRDVLTAKGYPLTYREYYGGHDYASWRGGLADGLAALLGASRTAVGGDPAPTQGRDQAT